MDQDDPFPEDFVCPTTTYVCAGTTANRSTVQMTRFNFYKLHISDSQIFLC
jgi:hypothetical protein